MDLPSPDPWLAHIVRLGHEMESARTGRHSRGGAGWRGGQRTMMEGLEPGSRPVRFCVRGGGGLGRGCVWETRGRAHAGWRVPLTHTSPSQPPISPPTWNIGVEMAMSDPEHEPHRSTIWAGSSRPGWAHDWSSHCSFRGEQTSTAHTTLKWGLACNALAQHALAASHSARRWQSWQRSLMRRRCNWTGMWGKRSRGSSPGLRLHKQ